MTQSLHRFRETLDELAGFSSWVTMGRAEIDRDGTLSAEGKAKKRGELDRLANERFEQLRDDYQASVGHITSEARDAAQFVYDPAEYARKRPYSTRAGKPEQLLLDEMRLQRTWQRLQRRLDAGETLGSLAAEAAEQGDLTTLRALRLEGPSVLRTTARTNPGGPDVRQAEAELVDTIDTAVADLVGGSDGDELRAGAELRRIAPSAQTVLESAVKALSATGSTLGGTSRIAQGYAMQAIREQQAAAE